MATSDENTKKLEIQLNKLEAKIDDGNDHLASIDLTLAQQHESIKHHIRRTNALETIVLTVNRKVTLAEGALKLFGALSVLGGLVALVKSLI